MSIRDQRILGITLRKQHFSPRQLQVIFGTLLGDSSLNMRSNGSYRLKMSHSLKQLNYLEFKKKLLEPFIIQLKATFDNSYLNNPDSFSSAPSYHYNSIVHQDFTDIAGLVYKNIDNHKRKYINMNLLNRIQPTAMLFWFLDDGCYHYNSKKHTHTMYLSTYRYSLPEHRTLKKWFWHHWKIDSQISFDKTHNMFTLRFNKSNMIIFNNLFLKPFMYLVPSCMYYKFPKF